MEKKNYKIKKQTDIAPKHSIIKVFCTTEQHTNIKINAIKAGMKITNFAFEMIDKGAVNVIQKYSPEEIQAINSLRGIAANLNQAVKALNTTKQLDRTIARNIDEVLKQIDKALK